jgi:hypothetical protein
MVNTRTRSTVGGAAALALVALSLAWPACSTAASQPAAPSTLCVNGKCANTATTVVGGIKWHPGQYMGSSVLTNVPNANSNNGYRQGTEIPSLRSGPSVVLGETCYYFWTVFENTTAGAYNFSAIDSDYVALTGYVSGTATSAVYNAPRRMNIYFVQTDYFSTNPSYRGTVPAYMLNSSAYGASPVSGQYGWWTTTGASGVGSGSGIAFWRPAVMARLQALMTAMANHVLPDGYTVDTSPYIEWIKPYLETSDPPANSGTVSGTAADATFTTNSYLTQLEALNSTMNSVFPHTNYATPANFTAGNPYGDGSEDVALIQSLPAVRSGVGGPDVLGWSAGQNPGCPGGICGINFGQGAYIGLVPPAGGANPFTTSWVTNNGTLSGVNEIGVIPFIATIQGSEIQGGSGEVSFPAAVLFQQANATLHATHLEWVFLGNGQQCSGSSAITTCLWYGNAASNPPSWSTASGGVLAQIVSANLSNTACPTSYKNGCNTN